LLKRLGSPMHSRPNTRLYTTIAGTDYLSPPDQASLVAQLQFGLREDGDHDAARNDIVTLLTKLRDREDVTYRTRTDVDAILASIDAEAHIEPAPQPSGVTATTAHPVSPGSTTTLGARPTEPEDTAITETTEARVDTPRPNKTTAEKMTVAPPRSQRQSETARAQEKSPSASGLRNTQIPVGLAVTAVILIAAGGTLTLVGSTQPDLRYNSRWPYYIPAGICIGIATALIIAIVVVLVRRNAASAPQRLPPGR
jgi:hypothetical protein